MKKDNETMIDEANQRVIEAKQELLDAELNLEDLEKKEFNKNYISEIDSLGPEC